MIKEKFSKLKKIEFSKKTRKIIITAAISFVVFMFFIWLGVGMYISVPEEWAEKLTVSRITALESSQVFSFGFLENGETTTLFTIAALSGENRQKTLEENGWEKLTEKGDVLYACRLGDGGVTIEELRAMFDFIRVDWNTGETEK